MNTHILWCDLETSDLEPHNGEILEACFKLTELDTTPIWSASYVFHYDWRLHQEEITPVVLEMHTKNGLFEECLRSTMRPGTMEIEISEMLARYGKKMALGGNSVHFDRKWLEYKTPSVIDSIHYRNVDVSSFYPMLNWLGLVLPSTGTNHRASGDVDASISEYNWIYRLLKGRVNA